MVLVYGCKLWFHFGDNFAEMKEMELWCRLNSNSLLRMLLLSVWWPTTIHIPSGTALHVSITQSSFQKSCIFIFWASRTTQNLTGWKRWVLVEKLTPFDEILRQTYKNWQMYVEMKNFTQKDLTGVKIFQKVLGGTFLKYPVGWAQDRERLPVRNQRSTNVPRHQNL